MSLTISQRVWSDSDLKGSHKLMALALADLADDDGFSWPGFAKLTEMTGVKKRQIINLLDHLRETKKIIVWEQQGQHGGRGFTNIYMVVVGLETSQIVEIVARRFAANREETKAILSKSGDLYIELCHLKRVQSSALKQTRKGAIPYTETPKRVQSSTKKGALDCTRTIKEPLDKRTTTTNAGAEENLSLIVGKYQELISTTISGTMADEFNDYAEQSQAEWITYAFKQAEDNTALKWSYVRKVLENCIKRGGIVDKPKNGTGPPPPNMTPAQQARFKDLHSQEAA